LWSRRSRVRVPSLTLVKSLPRDRFCVSAPAWRRRTVPPGLDHEPLTCQSHAPNATRMSTIQIRNVPGQLHKQLKVRAAQQGRTLSDYLLDELRVAAARPTMHEWIDALDALPPGERAPTPAAQVIAEERRR